MSQSPVKIWRKQKIDKKYLGMKGEILSWTKIFIAPSKFSDDTPYIVLLVLLENNEKIYGQYVDHEDDDVKIGKKVETVLRRNGKVEDEAVVEYGIKFQPL